MSDTFRVRPSDKGDIEKIMKAYQHSLGKVLDHKNEEYEKLQMALSAANEQVQQVRSERESRQQCYETHLQKSDQKGVIQLEAIRMAAAHSDYLRERIHQQVKLEERAKAELEKTKQHWLEARREVQVLESHKAMEEKFFLKAQDKLAQQLLDEMAVNQYFRRRQSL